MAIASEGFPLYFDCANENGLAIAGLNFPGYAYFPDDARPGTTAVAPYEFPLWVTSNFDNVDDVEAALANITLVNKGFGDFPIALLHWIIADASGCIVVESTADGLQVMRDPADVLANQPGLAWHLENLRSYMNVTPGAPSSVTWGNATMTPFGAGAGMRGLPGDVYSPSRFVRAAYLNAHHAPKDTERGNVARVFRTLGGVAGNLMFKPYLDGVRGYDDTRARLNAKIARNIRRDIEFFQYKTFLRYRQEPFTGAWYLMAFIAPVRFNDGYWMFHDMNETAGIFLQTLGLYSRVAGMVARAGIDFLIGIGPRLKRYAALFACDKEFFTATDECVARINRDAVAGRAILLKGARDFRFEKLVHLLSRKSHTTVLEVDLDAMIHNLNYFRSKLSFGTRLVAMVKAGSYGAGDFEVAQMLQHQGVDYLAVAFADEGVLLRERGISMPIVVLNADADSFDVMIANRLEPEIYSFHSLGAFADAVTHAGETRYPIHVKLDTGMHRLGFVEQEIAQLCATLAATPQVKAASVFSHLNCADMPEEDAYTRAQIALYDRMSAQLAASLPYPVIRHAANSAAIERFPEAQFDMCRLGLGLYGFGFRHNDALRPVSTLKTRIVQIKRLPAGDAVGYGRAGKLTRPTTTATIPIGYADGLDRHLGCGRWSVLVAGQPAPIIGRVCMDSCMIDITDIPGVKEGDEVSVFSPVPGNDLETMARVLDTISYEIMTSVSGRVKRIYLKE